MALSAYNRKKQILAPYVEGLIQQLTGFKENDNNFHLVANFVYSNIIYHNFATVDIATVHRSIKGIAEKLKIHGYTQRGRRLLELVDKYVSSDSSHHTQLNVQWNVLLLLLKLSYKPTSVSDDALKAVQIIPEVEVPQENIDWNEYLLEGWEKFQCPNTGSDEDQLWLSGSDDEGIDESIPCKHLVQVPRSGIGQHYETLGYGAVPHPSMWGLHTPSPPRQEAMRRLMRETNQSEDWLCNNVQNAWWSGTSWKTVPESVHFPAHMNEIWENSMLSKHGRDSSQQLQIQVLSEFKVVHEVLWMLQVPSDTSLFQLDDDEHFFVKANTSLPSTIPETLRLVMEGLCPYFNMINKFKRFEEELSEQEMSENPPPMTYKAYCAALFQVLHVFKKLVIDIETRHNQQEETMTLLSVIEELTPRLNIIQYLYNIHSRAVTEWHTKPPWLCATRLLSVLYEALLETSDQMYLETSLNVFIHSFHVYLDIIDVWLSEGRLEDWRNEFLVIRKDDNLEVMPYEEEMQACGVLPVSLLSKLVIVVRDAGRTMEVVSQLNKLTELRETVLNKGNLFKEFSENVYKEINRLKENIQIEPSEGKDSANVSPVSNSINMSLKKDVIRKMSPKYEESECQTSTLDLSEETSPLEHKVETNGGEGERVLQESISQPDYLLYFSSKNMNDQVMKTLVDNPLLTEALHGYVCIREQTSSYPKNPTALHFQSAHSVPLVGLMSMHNVLEKQLELVIRRHKIASSLVTQTLRSDYSLQKQFSVLRTVFFMEAGNLAQSFYSYLFKEIESGTWNDMLNLSVQLQVCVEEFHPGFGNYFSVLVSGRDLTVDVHQAIPSISLAYRVDWPVSLVITQDTIDSYNKVFRFLLHLKYAFWTLHNIRFSDLYDSPNTLVVRRLHVLKLWMYHSTNTLHAYFMGLVLRSFSTHLEKTIELADSIDTITQAHLKFLNEVKKHCLQDKKSYVEKFIMKLLRLCSSLSDHWRMEAAGTLTTSDLSALENEYMIAYRGLTHCLDSVTSDSQSDDFLSELKNEFSYSEPSSPSS